jgi:predicted dehydrogenase
MERKGMTRRDFAKTTAAMGFAALAARGARAQDSAETLKVGLLGCGGRGGGALFQMLEGNDRVQVTALADLFEDRLGSVRDALRQSAETKLAGKVALEDEQCFVGFGAYRQILATDIDILIEGTLPYSRPLHLVEAMKAGKHIFTEKPAASDSAGIRLILDAIPAHEAAGLSFVAGTQRRHQQEYIQTIDKIHNGEIGDVLAMRVYWNGSLPFIKDREEGWSDFEYRVRNWYGYCWTSGDNIVEQHVHNLDIANWVLGAHPDAVVASGGRAWKPLEEKYGDLFDHFSCDYEYPGGMHMFSFSRHWNNSHNDVMEEAIGSKRSVKCWELGEAGENPYYQEHRNLVNSIRGDGPKYHEARQVCDSTLTGIMGRTAAYTGKRVTWDEALNDELVIVPEAWSFDAEYPVRPVPVPGS